MVYKYSGTKFSQLIPCFVLAIAWFLFWQSSQQYQSVDWYGWLRFSRLFLVGFGIFIVWRLLRGSERNWIFLYLNMSLIVQCSHGIYEGPRSTEFYNFTGVIFLAAALTFQGSFRSWISKVLPLQLFFLLVPLFFKSSYVLWPVSNFVDHFSLPIAGVVLGLIVAFNTSKKFEAINRHLDLQQYVLEKELNWRKALQEEVTKLRGEIEVESRRRIQFEIARQVAHDIRSPVLALEAVLEGTDDLPLPIGIVLKKVAQRIKDIAESVLGTSAANNPEIFEQVDLKILLKDLIQEKTLEYSPNRGLFLRYTSEEGSVYSAVDASQFKRVLSNLINNAIEASSGIGEIRVSLSVENGFNIIRIVDQGKGIPDDALIDLNLYGKIRSTKEGGRGGLGISNAFSVVGRFAGSLNFKSDKTGTIVSISLPCSNSEIERDGVTKKT